MSGNNETGGCEVPAKDCTDLDEFWNYVSPIGEAFSRPSGQTGFLFRGQGDSCWKLVPNIYRAKTIAEYNGHRSSLPLKYPDHLLFEWGILKSFIEHCDLNGLPIAGNSMQFQKDFSWDRIGDAYGKDTNGWPERGFHPVMALAQHHGLPTRLLDWSSNPFVACYFAAEAALREFSPDSCECKKLAFFAFDLDKIGLFQSQFQSQLEHVQVPGSTSVNLWAQAGSFILVQNSGTRNDNFEDGISLESKIRSCPTILTKVTLPQSLAGALMERCRKHGVSASSLFPGYDGAVRAVSEIINTDRAIRQASFG